MGENTKAFAVLIASLIAAPVGVAVLMHYMSERKGQRIFSQQELDAEAKATDAKRNFAWIKRARAIIDARGVPCDTVQQASKTQAWCRNMDGSVTGIQLPPLHAKTNDSHSDPGNPVTVAAQDPCTALLKHVAAAALDAGPDCITVLAPRLTASDSARHAAAYALALMGDPKAQDALYASLARSRDTGIAALAAVGAASIQRPEDVSFLCAALRGEYGDWEPIEAAALSLGLVRSTACKAALEQAAKEMASIAGHAARQALAVITAKPSCRGRSKRSDSEAAVAAVMNCAVPRSEEAPAFYESAKGRVWSHAGGRWATRPPKGREFSTLPGIGFSVVFGQKRERALVSVSRVFGQLNAKGYDYLIARQGTEWVVVAIQSTWIA